MKSSLEEQKEEGEEEGEEEARDGHQPWHPHQDENNLGSIPLAASDSLSSTPPPSVVSEGTAD